VRRLSARGKTTVEIWRSREQLLEGARATVRWGWGEDVFHPSEFLRVEDARLEKWDKDTERWRIEKDDTVVI